MRHGTRGATHVRNRLLGLGLAALALARCASLGAQDASPAQPFAAVRYVLDASGSMRARFGAATKLDVAREMLLTLDRELARGGAAPPTGLWVYGAGSPRRARDCRDVRAVVRDPTVPLERALAGIEPAGLSPLVHSLETVAAGGGDPPQAWVVFTDGSDNCDRDPCAWAAAAAALPARPRIYLVGLGLEEEDRQALSCLAEATSGYVLDVGPEDAWEPEIARLAARLENRGTLRVEARVAGETVPLQGRVFRAGSATALRTVRAGRPEELPGGMYRVVLETLPPTVFERVLVTPGGEQVLTIDDLAGLNVRAFDADNRPLSAYVSLLEDRRAGEEMYVSAGQPAAVLAGRYRLTVEVADSVVLRRTIDLSPGEIRTVTAGGTGYVVAQAPGLPDLAGVDVELHDYESGSASQLRPWQTAAPVAAGEYRALVRTLPLYVREQFTVAPAETSTLVVPGLGTLEVELTDAAGRPLTVPVTLLRPEGLPQPGGGEDVPGAVLGTFPSGVRQAVLAGTYDLLVETEPSRIERDVRVDAGAGRVVSISLPEDEGS